MKTTTDKHEHKGVFKMYNTDDVHEVYELLLETLGI
jgi:hypothetical protein